MLSRLPLDRFDSAGKVGDLGGKEVILSRLGVAFSNRLRSHSGASVTVVDLLLWLFFQQSTGDYTDNLVVYEMALFYINGDAVSETLNPNSSTKMGVCIWAQRWA
jgi:hypothetical protein